MSWAGLRFVSPWRLRLCKSHAVSSLHQPSIRPDLDHAISAVFQIALPLEFMTKDGLTAVIRWDEKAGLRRDAIRSQVIDALEAQEIKETGNEED